MSREETVPTCVTDSMARVVGLVTDSMVTVALAPLPKGTVHTPAIQRKMMTITAMKRRTHKKTMHS